MSKIIVLDTSFLIELFKIPMDSNQQLHDQAIVLLEDAIRNKYDIYCPVSVLYELANHIVDIKSHEAQRSIAEKFTEMVLTSWHEKVPFIIIPGDMDDFETHGIARLPELCNDYKTSIRQGLGLTDCTTIDTARKLKASYTERLKRWPTHIWTLHRKLKAMEPDKFEHQSF